MLLEIRAALGFPRRVPFGHVSSAQGKGKNKNPPSGPNCVDVHSLGNVDNQLHVGVIVVVGAAGHLYARDQRVF